MAAELEDSGLAPAAFAVHNSRVQGLYAIVDWDALRGRSVSATEVAAALIEGGASTLQLRAKGATLADARALAAPLAELEEPRKRRSWRSVPSEILVGDFPS